MGKNVPIRQGRLECRSARSWVAEPGQSGSWGVATSHRLFYQRHPKSGRKRPGGNVKCSTVRHNNHNKWGGVNTNKRGNGGKCSTATNPGSPTTVRTTNNAGIGAKKVNQSGSNQWGKVRIIIKGQPWVVTKSRGVGNRNCQVTSGKGVVWGNGAAKGERQRQCVACVTGVGGGRNVKPR